MGKTHHSTGKHNNPGLSRENQAIWTAEQDSRTFDHFSPVDTDIGNGENLQNQLTKQAGGQKHAPKVIAEDKAAAAIQTIQPQQQHLKHKNIISEQKDADSGKNLAARQQPQKLADIKPQQQSNANESSGQKNKIGKSVGKNKTSQSSYTYSSPKEMKQVANDDLFDINSAASSKRRNGQKIVSTNPFALLTTDE